MTYVNAYRADSDFLKSQTVRGVLPCEASSYKHGRGVQQQHWHVMETASSITHALNVCSIKMCVSLHPLQCALSIYCNK